jgi:hypothetical protein
LRKLFEEVFLPTDIHIQNYGNVLTANALLQGLAVEELRRKELDYDDPDYELLIAVRAIKSVENDDMESKKACAPTDERKTRIFARVLVLSSIAEEVLSIWTP